MPVKRCSWISMSQRTPVVVSSMLHFIIDIEIEFRGFLYTFLTPVYAFEIWGAGPVYDGIILIGQAKCKLKIERQNYWVCKAFYI